MKSFIQLLFGLIFMVSATLCAESLEEADEINKLGIMILKTGELSAALPVFERACAIREKALGPDHPVVAASKNDLACVYAQIGNYAKALPLFEQALAIWEENLGTESPVTAGAMNNLAQVYSETGDYGKALPLLRMTMAIKQKTLGPEHPETAGTLLNLATVYMNLGDHARARPLFEESLAIFQKLPGPAHPETAMILNNLANNYIDMGDYIKALPLHERALAIKEKNFNIADVILSLNNLARLTYMMGNLPASRDYALRAISAKQKQLQSILNLDERSRLAWQKENLSYWSACVIPPEALAELTLRQKGVVLDSLIEDRASALAAGTSGEGASILQQIKSLQGRLSKIVFEKEREKEASKMQDEIGVLQRSLVSKFLGRDRLRASATITMDEVASRLAGGSLLMDFIQFADPK